jgi:hypothetical protein
MLLKLESPPLGIELSNVQMQTSQTLMSLNVSSTCYHNSLAMLYLRINNTDLLLLQVRVLCAATEVS